ncbi:hypothetical protein [Granulosicoccus antarcticus]|uniref:Uncharacterized protein n=1 Tax=Granulosicoccus antarcticus IMCC3135 TaxID=1192854 RepID=A0A2Z2NJ61_9GAMM|nr:hypothetical protein [Granulosicoccus antarcticus]ASJ70535.1 hypothetical protein IMCC3135_02105 [Granulosicoccus antarcticus IMCC3135]
MGDVIPFGRKPVAKKSTLCQNNHHKWDVVKDAQFDVRQGKLVTIERCARCGKTRNRLT